MTYIKIGETLYPASINGKFSDTEWDKRKTKTITLEMDYITANTLFVDGLAWSIVTEIPVEVEHTDEEGNVTIETVMETEEFNNSDYFLAGAITDYRDGRVSVKMGKLTDLEEAYELMLGGI